MEATQTVTINASFASKLSKDYNSSQHSIGLETTIKVNPANAEVEVSEASKNLFDLAHKLVKAQEPTPAPPSNVQEPQQIAAQFPATNGGNGGNGNGGNGNGRKPASEKQVKCIFARAKSKNLNNDQINNLPTQYGKAV